MMYNYSLIYKQLIECFELKSANKLQKQPGSRYLLDLYILAAQQSDRATFEKTIYDAIKQGAQKKAHSKTSIIGAYIRDFFYDLSSSIQPYLVPALSIGGLLTLMGLSIFGAVMAGLFFPGLLPLAIFGISFAFYIASVVVHKCREYFTPRPNFIGASYLAKMMNENNVALNFYKGFLDYFDNQHALMDTMSIQPEHAANSTDVQPSPSISAPLFQPKNDKKITHYQNKIKSDIKRLSLEVVALYPVTDPYEAHLRKIDELKSSLQHALHMSETASKIDGYKQECHETMVFAPWIPNPHPMKFVPKKEMRNVPYYVPDKEVRAQWAKDAASLSTQLRAEREKYQTAPREHELKQQFESILEQLKIIQSRLQSDPNQLDQILEVYEGAMQKLESIYMEGIDNMRIMAC